MIDMVTLSCLTDPNHREFCGPWGRVDGRHPVYVADGPPTTLTISERIRAVLSQNIFFLCTTCGESAQLEPNV
jgi:hypothetical protein